MPCHAIYSWTASVGKCVFFNDLSWTKATWIHLPTYQQITAAYSLREQQLDNYVDELFWMKSACMKSDNIGKSWCPSYRYYWGWCLLMPQLLVLRHWHAASGPVLKLWGGVASCLQSTPESHWKAICHRNAMVCIIYMYVRKNNVMPIQCYEIYSNGLIHVHPLTVFEIVLVVLLSCVFAWITW